MLPQAWHPRPSTGQKTLTVLDCLDAWESCCLGCMDELTQPIAGLVGHAHVAHLSPAAAAAAAEGVRAPGMPAAQLNQLQAAMQACVFCKLAAELTCRRSVHMPCYQLPTKCNGWQGKAAKLEVPGATPIPLIPVFWFPLPSCCRCLPFQP